MCLSKKILRRNTSTHIGTENADPQQFQISKLVKENYMPRHVATYRNLGSRATAPTNFCACQGKLHDATRHDIW